MIEVPHLGPMASNTHDVDSSTKQLPLLPCHLVERIKGASQILRQPGCGTDRVYGDACLERKGRARPHAFAWQWLNVCVHPRPRERASATAVGNEPTRYTHETDKGIMRGRRKRRTGIKWWLEQWPHLITENNLPRSTFTAVFVARSREPTRRDGLV